MCINAKTEYTRTGRQKTQRETQKRQAQANTEDLLMQTQKTYIDLRQKQIQKT